jgi:MFS family permease
MSRPWLWLLGAKTISTIGSRLTIVAMPLIAILTLNASPLEMGVLQACAFAPNAVLGPFIGAFIDRNSKLRLLILTNCLNGAALGLLVVAYSLNSLSVFLLTAITFFAATISVGEEIALLSFIPNVVERSHLAVANSHFRSITAGASVAGTALAGILIAALTAPGTVAVDAATFFIAALCINLIPRTEPPATARGEAYLTGLRAGLRFVVGNSEFAPIVIAVVFVNLFGSSFEALESLFVVRDLNVSASWFAGALTAGAAAGPLGAFLSGKVSNWVDIRVLLAMGMGLITISVMGVSLLAGAPDTVAILFGCCCAVTSFGGILVNVALGTMLQERAPANILGSVTGIFYAILLSVTPIGTVVSGFLAELIGTRVTLIGSAVGLLGVFVLFSGYCAIFVRRGDLPAV